MAKYTIEISEADKKALKLLSLNTNTPIKHLLEGWVKVKLNEIARKGVIANA